MSHAPVQTRVFTIIWVTNLRITDYHPFHYPSIYALPSTIFFLPTLVGQQRVLYFVVVLRRPSTRSVDVAEHGSDAVADMF
jgi:hypothetical protein